jgi:hypothetical protein
MSSTKGKSISRERKHDTSKNLEAWTKKQHDTPRALQVGYSECKQQPLSEITRFWKKEYP